MSILYTPELAHTHICEAKENLAKLVDSLDALSSLRNCPIFSLDEELVAMYRHATGIRYALQRVEKPVKAQRAKVLKGKLKDTQDMKENPTCT
jgi:hypothetical protein